MGRRTIFGLVLVVLAASCGDDDDATSTSTGAVQPPATEPALLAATTPSTTEAPSTTSAISVSTTVVSAESRGFPTTMFAALGDELVSDVLAAELQDVLDTSANGDGLAATLMTPEGTWTGASGFAVGDREMSPDDQMAIGSITKSIVAAQVMQLVEAGELRLDDPAADRLPPGLEFDTNGATIGDLLAMRSGIPDYVDALWTSLSTDKLHAWTPDEVLALVGTDRARAGDAFSYSSTNYVLLGLIVEHVTGRPLGEVLRDGVLSGDGYERLIYQPAEPPSEPTATSFGDPANTLEASGGYLPSLAGMTAAGAAGAMASDSPTLARWWRELCAGRVVSAASLDEMTDFAERPEYGLGIVDYGRGSGWVGHGGLHVGFSSAAVCVPEHSVVVVVLANSERGLDAAAYGLVQAASS
jgi:D-alanyl-D-alanine carboxypeptidase